MAKRGKSNKSVSLAKIKGFSPIAIDQDGPTAERLAKLPGVQIFTKPGGKRVPVLADGMRSPVGADGVVRVTQSPLDRLAALGRLDPDADRNAKLFDAGDRLRQHWYLAGLDGGPSSIDLNRAGGGNGDPAWLTPSSESAAYHRDRFRRAREGMEAGHWQVVFGISCAEETLEGAGRQAGFANRGAAAAVALDRLTRPRIAGDRLGHPAAAACERRLRSEPGGTGDDDGGRRRRGWRDRRADGDRERGASA